MVRWVETLAVFFLLAAPAVGRPPLDVSLCDLLKDPASYNNKLVRVRGRVSIAFEDFSLENGGCPANQNKRSALAVWLIYGGDQSAPTAYCCGDHSRKPGKFLKLHGKPVPLLKDADLEEFEKRLTAKRLERPDGLMCVGRECYLYDVSATITGHFLAAEETKRGGWAGYGHLGCCHALTIEQVSNVDARRTAVPAGGTFNCKPETWDVPLPEVKDLLSNYSSCSGSEWCEAARRQVLEFGAAHWGVTPMELRDWTGQYRDEADYTATSPDLLSTFELKFPFDNVNTKKSRSNFLVLRTVCTERTAALSQSSPVSCKTTSWVQSNPKRTARRLQNEFDLHGQNAVPDLRSTAWRLITKLSGQNNLRLLFDAASLSCDEDMIGDDIYGSCHAVSRDGTQSVWANLIRHGFLKTQRRPLEKVIWALQSAELEECSGDSGSAGN